MDRREWLEARRKGIGASDVASIMGYGYGSPLKVWLSKVHPEMLEEEDNKELLEFGLDVEPAIARAYSRATGRKIVDISGYDIVSHPKYPEVFCTPDLFTAEEPRRLVQLKWQSKFTDKFGSPGTDEVPDGYLIQCAQEMAVVGVEFEDIATLHAGPPVLIYPLRRDPDLEKVVIDAARAFWADYVLTKKEPPIDASRDWAQYIEKRWPKNKEELQEAGPMEKVGRRLCKVKSLLSRLHEKEDELENRIKRYIADADGIEGDFGRITWRRSKDRKEDVVDWEAVVAALILNFDIPDQQVQIILDHNTQRDVIVRKGSRRFVTNFK